MCNASILHINFIVICFVLSQPLFVPVPSVLLAHNGIDNPEGLAISSLGNVT